MTLPTGTIYLSQVNTELGRSSTAAIDLNDSAVRSLAGAGGSGTAINMDQLRGKSAVTLSASIPHNDIITAQSFGSSATVTYYFDSNGNIYISRNNGSYDFYHTWRTGAGSTSGQYELYATLTGGTLSSGPTNAWNALSGTRAYIVNDYGNSDGSVTATLNFQIRNAGGSTVLAYADVTLEATLGSLA